MTPRLVEVRKNVLKHNDELARALRRRFADSGVYVVSLVSSPGSGKTALLERLLAMLSEQHRVAALVGDLATENDAARLARSGAPVKQITTGTVCHLEAQMVDARSTGWDLDALDFLFIENVGNLVCPASYDLGENLRHGAPLRHGGRGQAAEVPDDLQYRGRRGDHEDGSRRRGRVRRHGGAAQHRRGPRRHANVRALVEDRRGNGRADRVSARGLRGARAAVQS